MTGAEEHALALESDWSRNAHGTQQPANLSEPMPSVENGMETMTSMLWAEYAAWLSLRTLRLGACTTSAIVGVIFKGLYGRMSTKVRPSWAICCCIGQSKGLEHRIDRPSEAACQ